MDAEFLSEAGKYTLEGLVAFSTFGLWFSTARMNHIEKSKMVDALKHDNDNITEIAHEAINSNNRHLEQLHSLKKVSRRNRKGGIR